MVDGRRSLPLMKKNPFTTVDQIKNTFPEGRFICVKVNNKKQPTPEYKGLYPKLLVSLKIRKNRLLKTRAKKKKILKKSIQYWNIKWTDGTTCTRIMEREKYGERKELLMIWSIPPHLMMWVCMAAIGTGSLVFIDDVTAEWILKCIGQWPKAYL